MQIRQTCLNDVNEIIEMQILMALETESLHLDKKTLKDGITAIIEDPTKGRYFIIEESRISIACFMITYEWSDWRNKNWIWMQSVYVKKEYRKQGIFNKMMSFLKKMISSDSQYCGIRLYVDKTNLNAINVYKKSDMLNHHYEMFEWNK